MGTAIEGCGYLVCLHVDKAGFGGCGTAVHAQYVFSACNCPAMLCREVGDLGKLSLKALKVGEAYLVLCDELAWLRHRTSIFFCQICCTKCLKVRCLLRDDKFDIRSLLLDEPDDMTVPGDSSHKNDLAFAYSRFLEEVDDLHSHHVAEGKYYILFCSLPLVEPVGAVALHEYRAPG